MLAQQIVDHRRAADRLDRRHPVAAGSHRPQGAGGGRLFEAGGRRRRGPVQLEPAGSLADLGQRAEQRGIGRDSLVDRQQDRTLHAASSS